MYTYVLILLSGVIIASFSQVMLKKAALKTYKSWIAEYVNPLVIGAYTLFVLTTLLSILAYKGLPLSMGPVIESTSYVFITVWGRIIFKEKVNFKAIFGLIMIIVGVIICTIF